MKAVQRPKKNKKNASPIVPTGSAWLRLIPTCSRPTVGENLVDYVSGDCVVLYWSLWFSFPFCSHTCPPDAFFIIVIILNNLIFFLIFPGYLVARKTPGNSRAPPPYLIQNSQNRPTYQQYGLISRPKKTPGNSRKLPGKNKKKSKN